MHFVGIVKFIMPEKSKRETEEWKLQTDPDDSVEINLSFTPAGTRKVTHLYYKINRHTLFS